MPQPDHFRYSLRKEISFGNYEYYAIDTSGSVITQVAPYYLKHAPDGWIDKSLFRVRNWDKYGLFTALSVPNKFVIDGAKIIRHLIYSDGIEANALFFIEKLNETDESYSLFFRGEVDLSTIVDEQDYCTVIIKNEKYVEKLLAREDSDYEIDLDGNPNAILVNIDGVSLRHTINYSTIKEPVDVGGNHTDSPSTSYSSERMPFIVAGQPDGTGNGDLQYQSFTPPSSLPLMTPYAASGTEIPLGRENDWILHNDSTTTYSITLNIDFQMLFGSVAGSPDSGRLRVYAVRAKKGSPFTIQNKHLIFLSGSISPGTNATVQCTSSNSITMTPDDAIWITCTVEEDPLTPTPGNNYYIRVYQGDINITYFNKLPQVFVPALRPNDVFGELVDKMSDGGTTHFSNVLDVDYKDFVVTSGDGLRNLPQSKLKTTFNSFWESFNPILNLGTSYDNITNRHVIDYKSAYFQKNSPILHNGSVLNLGEVSGCQVRVLRDRIFTKLLAGYADYTYDGLNGIDEPNSKAEFLTSFTKEPSEKDMLSTYRADFFGVSFTTANLIGKVSTDSDSDNDQFLLNIEPVPGGTHNGVPYFNLFRQPGMSIVGLISPSTAFNINFSPKRNILRSGSYIRSYLSLMASDLIKHQTTSKNGGMITNDGITIVAESFDFPVSSLDDPLFYPITFEFEAVLPINIQQILDTNPYGYFEFEYRGTTWEAFILEFQENPAFREPQRLKALLTPNNDLSKLE